MSESSHDDGRAAEWAGLLSHLDEARAELWALHDNLQKADGAQKRAALALARAELMRDRLRRGNVER